LGAGLLFLGLLEIIGPCVWDPVELDLAELARARAEGHGSATQGGGPAALSIALSFRALGTTAWAGRLPMFAFGAICAAATYAFAARFFSRRAAMFSVLVLVTTPLYFANARTMTGEIVPLACIASSFAAFAHAAFGEAARRRTASLALAVAFGLVAAASRGALVGIAVPALAVGLAWAMTRDDAADARFGKAVLAIGGAAAAIAFVAIFVSNERVVSFGLGHAVAASKRPSFDAPIAQIAYAFFPWSAVLPLALMSLGRAVPRGARGGPRIAVLLGMLLAMAAHAALAPRTGVAPLAGASFFALAAGITLAGLDAADGAGKGAGAVRLTAVTAMLGVAYLVTDDLARAPEKILEPFALVTTAQAFPAAFAPTVVRGVRIAGLVLVPFAIGAAFASRRRGALLLAGGVLSGLVLRLHVYPALFARVAPESALDTYGKKHAHGEKLGLLGVSRRALAYVRHAPTEEAVTLADPPHAADFLATTNAAEAPREWLALDTHDLPQVNALYRARRGHNAPVLAGGGDNVLLAVSELHAGEKDESPLAGFVLDGPPHLARTVHATFADRFEALAWDLTDDDGAALDHVAQRASFHFKIALRVKQPTPGGYCTFIHVDHSPTRVSIEHKDFAIYPMSLWHEGDVIVDDFPIKLPSHFGAGAYTIHFGIGVLPCEDDRRMPITAGASDGHDRLKVGTLEVR
jgi:hypothetical protein